MPTKSRFPDVDVPNNIDIWNWLFADNSPINRPRVDNSIGQFIDGITGETLQYEQIKEITVHASTALHNEYDFRKGDVVITFSPNCVQYPATLWSVLRLGGIISGASPAYGVEEMIYAIKTVKAKFIFTDPGSIGIAKQAATATGIDFSHIFLMYGKAEQFLNLYDLAEKGKQYPAVKPYTIPAGKTNGDECAFISFSSGTTGLPKGVMISHKNVIGQCLQMKAIAEYKPHEERTIAAIPLFHITGLVQLLHVPVMANMSVVTMPQFEMKTFLDVITRWKVTNLMLVPPIIIRFVRDPIVKNYDLSHVKMFMSGAAPLSKEIIDQLRAMYPAAGLWQGYGMTESASCITCTPKSMQFDPWMDDSVGMITPSSQLKIVDLEGNELPEGQAGEIWAKGPQVVMGYYQNDKATNETWDSDGFLHTGDIGLIRKDGSVCITDRLKEMIKVKGIPVAPAELEDLLLGHPKVEDCAVFGIKSEYEGELPRAYIVLKSGNKASKEIEDEIKNYVKEKRVKYKWLAGGIRFVDLIPKSPSGKILRRVIRDMESEEANKAHQVKAKL